MTQLPSMHQLDNRQKPDTAEWRERMYCFECHADREHRIIAYPSGRVLKICLTCEARGVPHE